MNNIKVSIIIPVHNVEIYVEKCLQSLVNQTLNDIEIILIDDCSIDNSYNICKKYSEKDERIVFIKNEKNLGVGATRNKGIEIAKGEYVGFVDSDDWVSLDFYEELYKSAKIKNYDIAKGVRVEVNNEIEKKILGLNTFITQGLKKGIPLYLLFTYEHWSAIYKRELLINKNIRYPLLSNGQDMLFLFYLCIHTDKIAINNNVFYYYNIREQSITFNKSIKYFQNILTINKTKIDFINNIDISKTNYDFAYNNIINHLINNYKTLIQNEDLKDYSKEYYRNLLNIFISYKYEDDFLKKLPFFFNTDYDSNFINDIVNFSFFENLKTIIKKIIKKLLKLKI